MTSIVVVRPPSSKETLAQKALAQQIENTAKSRGWRCEPTLRAIEIRSHSDKASGRPQSVLNPQDTESLYRLIHSSRCIVALTGDVRVRLNPRADPIAERAVIPIEKFVRYKASAVLIRSSQELQIGLTRADTAVNQLQSNGTTDPRILPLHLFCPSADYSDLNSNPGQAAFARSHGRASRRTDSENRHWSNGPAHGNTTLVVGGKPLPRGFHWDVASTLETSLMNGWEIWKIVRNGYANISPDASIRQGQRVRNQACKRVWHRGM